MSPYFFQFSFDVQFTFAAWKNENRTGNWAHSVQHCSSIFFCSHWLSFAWFGAFLTISFFFFLSFQLMWVVLLTKESAEPATNNHFHMQLVVASDFQMFTLICGNISCNRAFNLFRFKLRRYFHCTDAKYPFQSHFFNYSTIFSFSLCFFKVWMVFFLSHSLRYTMKFGLCSVILKHNVFLTVIWCGWIFFVCFETVHPSLKMNQSAWRVWNCYLWWFFLHSFSFTSAESLYS